MNLPVSWCPLKWWEHNCVYSGGLSIDPYVSPRQCLWPEGEVTGEQRGFHEITAHSLSFTVSLSWSVHVSAAFNLLVPSWLNTRPDLSYSIKFSFSPDRIHSLFPNGPNGLLLSVQMQVMDSLKRIMFSNTFMETLLSVQAFQDNLFSDTVL